MTQWVVIVGMLAFPAGLVARQASAPADSVALLLAAYEHMRPTVDSFALDVVYLNRREDPDGPRRLEGVAERLAVLLNVQTHPAEDVIHCAADRTPERVCEFVGVREFVEFRIHEINAEEARVSVMYAKPGQGIHPVYMWVRTYELKKVDSRWTVARIVGEAVTQPEDGLPRRHLRPALVLLPSAFKG